jgi:hypothetical protein
LAKKAEEGVESLNPRNHERAISDAARENHHDLFQPFYAELEIPSLRDATPVKADLLVMAACQDGGTTQDSSPNGAFTKALLRVWNAGAFDGDYVTFMDKIRAEMRGEFPSQIPAFTPKDPPAFSSERPFSV